MRARTETALTVCRLFLRGGVYAAFIFALITTSGCAFMQRAQQYADNSLRTTTSRTPQLNSNSGGQQITVQELDQLTYAFADRYLTYIVSACEQIEKNNPNAEQRRLAHQVKLVQVSSVYDIVTNAEPFTQLLDLTLVVTLQSQKWIDEDQADRWFGDRGKYLIEASRKAREDIWRIAARTMKPEQLEVLDNLIWDWRQKNPNIQLVSYVRFDDFAANRGKSIVADVKTGTGFLSPVDDAKKAVDEVRLLAERAFYIGKRMPFLMNWQLRSAMDETLSDPQVRELTTGLNRATNSMDRLPADIARERAAIFAAFHKEQPFMNQMMMQVRGSLNDGNQLAMNVRSVAQSSDQLLQTVDRLFMAPSRMTPKRGDEKPFDIAEYTKTITALNLALKEANQLVSTGSTLLASQQLDQLATKHVSEATVKGEGVVNVAFWRGVVLMVLFFVLLTVYRLLTHWLNRRART